MLDEDDVARAAGSLVRARRERAAVAPLRETYEGLDLDGAYAVQQEAARLRRDEEGDRVVGHKVGLTSAAMQQMLGVDQPDFGHLWASDLVQESSPDAVVGELAADRWVAPRVEPEIAFVLADALQGPGVSVDDVLAATRHVVASLEVIDSRVRDWDIRLVDTVADEASGGGAVLGGPELPVADVDLPAVEVRLLVDGEVVETGRGDAVLGHPAEAVAWLANTLGERGVALEAGHLVLPGSCTRAVPVRSGQTVRAEFEGLGGPDGRPGAVEVRFT